VSAVREVLKHLHVLQIQFGTVRVKTIFLNVETTDKMNVTSPTRSRILIVDDERSIADTLAIILTNAGYDACAAYSGDSAVAVARMISPALIVSDIQMPGMDGISAAIEIRKLLPECHVILFSGYPESHMQRARENGFNILSKPLSPQTLLKHIQSALQGRVKRSSAGSPEN
jgi:CheY-like chemotaxis protein